MRPQRWLYTVPLRLRSLFRGRAVERDLDDEVRFHLETQIDRLVARGMARGEARSAALRRFGGVEQKKEECRDMRHVRLVDELIGNVRYALRTFRKAPAFTAVALLTLALGIGASTTIFSIVDAVVLRPLPFDEPGRLVAVLEVANKDTAPMKGQTTPQTFLDWRAQLKAFDGLAAFSGASFEGRDPEGHPQTIRATRITSNFLAVVRVAPILGRPFTSAEEIRGRHRVAILSYGFWQRRFDGDPAVVGRTVALNDEPWQVVGVMPAGFEYPVATARPPDIYVPPGFGEQDLVRGSARNFLWTVIGRLGRGVSLEQASNEVDRLSIALDAQYPKWQTGGGLRAHCVPLQQHVVGSAPSWLFMLLGAVALVLLIACANVANLMLARATVRRPEIAIRAALGASRGAIARALLVESVLLSLVGAVLGLLLAWVGVRAVIPWLPPGLPRAASIAIDLRVLATAVSAALVVGVGFGLVPALQLSRPNLSAAVKGGGRSGAGDAGSHRLHGALVVSEVALAVVLVVGAFLLTGSFARLMQIGAGFDYTHLLFVGVGGGGAEARDYTERMLAAVSAVPGIQAGAVAGPLPLSGQFVNKDVTVGSRVFSGLAVGIEHRLVTPEYLKVLRLPLLRGRHLTDDDRAGTQPVVVINEAAARMYWPGQEALGQRLLVEKETVERFVVGIIGDIRSFGPEEPVRPESYIPLAQGAAGGAVLVMRTPGDPLKTLPAVRAAIWSVNKHQRISGTVFTLEQYMERLVAQRRFNMTLLALFSVVGLVIAAVGVFGVLAYQVAQRTGEIAVRMALGASAIGVLLMVLRRAGVLVGLGMAIGTGFAWYFSRLARAFLFQIEPTDPRVFAAALAVVACAGLAAAVVPARRAASVDPLVALRRE
jgi:putative ABC transport system permease protein